MVSPCKMLLWGINNVGSGVSEAAVQFNPGIITYDEADVLLCAYSVAKEGMHADSVARRPHTVTSVRGLISPPSPILVVWLPFTVFLSSLPRACLHLLIPSTLTAPVSIFPSISVPAVRFPPNHIYLLPGLMSQWLCIYWLPPFFFFFSPFPLPSRSVSPPLSSVCASSCSFCSWTFCFALVRCFLSACLLLSLSLLVGPQCCVWHRCCDCGVKMLYSGGTVIQETAHKTQSICLVNCVSSITKSNIAFFYEPLVGACNNNWNHIFVDGYKIEVK